MASSPKPRPCTRSGSHRHAAVAALAALALASACGSDDGADCDRVDGRYEASYEELSGTCGAYAGQPLYFDNTLAAMIMVYGDGRHVTTEAVTRGCTLHMTQTVERDGVVIEQVDGEALELMADGSAQGEVVLERFDARGAVTCTGSYDARLVEANLP